MRKAVIEINPYEGTKYNIIKKGKRNYGGFLPGQIVELTDWPIPTTGDWLTDDVYYTSTPVGGNHFFPKYADMTEKEAFLKRKKIFEIAREIITKTSYPVTIREKLEQDAPATKTLTNTEYKSIATWTQDLANKHKTFNVATVSIDDIYKENTAIFPSIPVDPKLNGIYS